MAEPKKGERIFPFVAKNNIWARATMAVLARVSIQLGQRDFGADPRKRYFFPVIWNSWDE